MKTSYYLKRTFENLFLGLNYSLSKSKSERIANLCDGERLDLSVNIVTCFQQLIMSICALVVFYQDAHRDVIFDPSKTAIFTLEMALAFMVYDFYLMRFVNVDHLNSRGNTVVCVYKDS